MNLSKAEAVREALQQIDLAEENARLSEIEGQIEKEERAIEEANARIARLGERITDIKREKLDAGERMANALLDTGGDTDMAEIAPSIEDLKSERETLAAGRVALNDRIQERRMEIKTVHSLASLKVEEAVEPLRAEISEIAMGHAAAILDCYAAMQALNAATSRRPPVTSSLEETAKAAMQDRGLIHRRGIVDVPEAVQDALSVLRDKGPALRTHLVASVDLY